MMVVVLPRLHADRVTVYYMVGGRRDTGNELRASSIAHLCVN